MGTPSDNAFAPATTSSHPLTRKRTTTKSYTKRACAVIERTTSTPTSVRPVGAGLALWNRVHLAADSRLNGASTYTSERAAPTALSSHQNRWVRCRPQELESARFVSRPNRCTSSRFAATIFALRAAGSAPTCTATRGRTIGAAFAGKRTCAARNVHGGWEGRETSRAFFCDSFEINKKLGWK